MFFAQCKLFRGHIRVCVAAKAVIERANLGENALVDVVLPAIFLVVATPVFFIIHGAAVVMTSRLAETIGTMHHPLVLHVFGKWQSFVLVLKLPLPGAFEQEIVFDVVRRLERGLCAEISRNGRKDNRFG